VPRRGLLVRQPERGRGAGADRDRLIGAGLAWEASRSGERLGRGLPAPSRASTSMAASCTPWMSRALTSLLGQPPWPGQWWVDGQGNYGLPGQPAMGNLVALANQRRGGSGLQLLQQRPEHRLFDLCGQRLRCGERAAQLLGCRQQLLLLCGLRVAAQPGPVLASSGGMPHRLRALLKVLLMSLLCGPWPRWPWTAWANGAAEGLPMTPSWSRAAGSCPMGDPPALGVALATPSSCTGRASLRASC